VALAISAKWEIWGRHRFRPRYALANLGHPCRAVRPAASLGETCGIPHLAKNERDMGHPATG
jgi:hypothetical protein